MSDVARAVNFAYWCIRLGLRCPHPGSVGFAAALATCQALKGPAADVWNADKICTLQLADARCRLAVMLAILNATANGKASFEVHQACQQSQSPDPHSKCQQRQGRLVNAGAGHVQRQLNCRYARYAEHAMLSKFCIALKWMKRNNKTEA